MKMSKNIVLLSVTIVILIGLVAIATYSYFTASTNINNKITTNVKMPLRPTFTVNVGGELALTITRNLTLKENSLEILGDTILNKSYVSATQNLSVTLTGEPGTTCIYNIYFKDLGSSLYNPVYNGGANEIIFYVSKNNIELFNTEYYFISSRTVNTMKVTALFGGSTAPFNQSKPTITIPPGNTSTTVNWKFSLLFYNRDWDQSSLAGKTFKGELYVGDVTCS